MRTKGSHRLAILLSGLALSGLLVAAAASATCGGGEEEGPILAITPTSGLTFSGVGKALTATVENNGKGPLEITSESASAGFEITGGIGGACVGEVLTFGETCPVGIDCRAKGEGTYVVKAKTNSGATLMASIKLKCD